MRLFNVGNQNRPNDVKTSIEAQLEVYTYNNFKVRLVLKISLPLSHNIVKALNNRDIC